MLSKSEIEAARETAWAGAGDAAWKAAANPAWNAAAKPARAVPVEVGRCRHKDRGLVCDLWNGHEDFHYDLELKISWTDELHGEPLPRYNAATALVVIGSTFTMLGLIALAIYLAVR